MLVSDAKFLYGYIDEPIEGDTNNLREDFNYYAGRIYNKLSFYFDLETVKEVYPSIYRDLCNTLQEGIYRDTKKSIFYIMIGASADTAVKRAICNVDPFSSRCILSNEEYNAIQKDIVRLSLPNMITGSSTGADYNTLINGDKICKMHNINRARYSLERLKAILKINKCCNSVKKIKKEKTLVIK